jgi:tRNA pseudouridine65 synthase
MAVPVLFRDESIVVVDKPSGVAVHRGWAAESDVLIERMRRQLGRRVFPVHRLDRGTSGVLVLALDAPAARGLSDAFAAGLVEKTYWALVRGVPEPEQLIDHPVSSREDGDGDGERDGDDDRNAVRLPARTNVRRLRVWGRYALVEARPQTGRLHQIRRHLKHISCPLIGDVNYGKGEHNRYFRENFGLHRLFLHALSLTLLHPRTGARLTFDAPLAAELARVLARLDTDAETPGPAAATSGPAK